MKRRHFVAHASLFSLLANWLPGLVASKPAYANAETLDEPRPFDRAGLVNTARTLAGKRYAPPVANLPRTLANIAWEDYQEIRFEPDESLWRNDDLNFQVQLFHLGLYFQHPVTIHEVVDGVARPIAYSSELFDYGSNRFSPPLRADLGFAGFRVHYHTDFERDMASFLGASYFRAVGGYKQYGLSARGLALDTGLPTGEEFPEFRSFWLERPQPGQTGLIVHALLDSPSITGAYTFGIQPGETTLMDVTATLFPRRTVQQIGIAPLTSMYQHGENDRRIADDFRPEIHDSDGLAIWTGRGERIWRPLVNSPVLRTNQFIDENPRGFGLVQRDRDFANYQDDGVYYDKRPNLWVEPKGEWGRGAVQLVEIPTGDETFDNIVAFWHPESPIQPGQELTFGYRLLWGAEAPDDYSSVGLVVATRLGRGGIPGQKRQYESRKFVIDFVGGDLGILSRDAAVEPVVSASRGRVEAAAARPIFELDGWRCNFDLVADGADPVDLRCYLRLGDAALTESWVYQWTPPAEA